MNQNRELYPLVSVDIALFSVVDEALKVLLVQRAQEPEVKRWAMPDFFAPLPYEPLAICTPEAMDALIAADGLLLDRRAGRIPTEVGTKLVQKLRAKVAADVLPLHLLPERFTLTQLQRVVEVISGQPLDKSSFRRRLKASKDLVQLDEFVRGAQRPAQLFGTSEIFVF